MTSFNPWEPWALLPRKASSDRRGARERARLYRENFRWLRAERQAEFCTPWVLGHELGWRLDSPVDVTLDPLEQIEVDPGDNPEATARAAAKSELWVRDGTALTMDRPPWLHLYQFRSGDRWENMFIPNGQDTVEWRLGFIVTDIGDQSVLIFGSEHSPDLGVKVGVLTSASLRRLQATGFSIAVSPQRRVTIRRGQEIARVALLHPDSLQARAEGEIR
jgi:hypothetical protein